MRAVAPVPDRSKRARALRRALPVGSPRQLRQGAHTGLDIDLAAFSRIRAVNAASTRTVLG